jgi:hypothetical protein
MSLDELALVFKTLSRVGAPDVDPKIIPFHYESTLRINKMRPLCGYLCVVLSWAQADELSQYPFYCFPIATTPNEDVFGKDQHQRYMSSPDFTMINCTIPSQPVIIGES